MNIKIKGFTLTELIITVAIIVILSSISVPIYRGQVEKAKLAEGYALLGAIKQAQINYYNEYRNFLWCGSGSAPAENNWFTANEEVLGINAVANKYFTWFRFGNSGEPYTSYGFQAIASAWKVGSIIMTYNITSGVTYSKILV